MGNVQFNDKGHLNINPAVESTFRRDLLLPDFGGK